MAEHIHSASGIPYPLIVNPDGTIGISGGATAGSKVYIYWSQNAGSELVYTSGDDYWLKVGVHAYSPWVIRGGEYPAGSQSNLVKPIMVAGNMAGSILSLVMTTGSALLVAGSVQVAGTVTTGSQTYQMNSLITKYYDAGSLIYTGANVGSVLYYSGGVAGTLINTLVLTYSGTEIVRFTVT
jgi:hypothetical protein